MLENRAKYTVVLKTLIDDTNVKPLLDKALSTYPMYEKRSKEEYIPSIIPTREQLNLKVLNAYKYREIGFETVGRFLDELEIAMCEIMPYYNQLFFTTDQDYNIIYNVDYKRTIDRDKTGTKTSESAGTSSSNTTGSETSKNTSSATDTGTTKNSGLDQSKNLKQDTPQEDIHTHDIDKVNYASEMAWNENSTSTNSTITGNTEGETNINSSHSDTESGQTSFNEDVNDTEKESTLETTKGNFGVVSAQDLVAKYREIIINIEQRIINDRRIKELFMQVY